MKTEKKYINNHGVITVFISRDYFPVISPQSASYNVKKHFEGISFEGLY